MLGVGRVMGVMPRAGVALAAVAGVALAAVAGVACWLPGAAAALPAVQHGLAAAGVGRRKRLARCLGAQMWPCGHVQAVLAC